MGFNKLPGNEYCFWPQLLHTHSILWLLPLKVPVTIRSGWIYLSSFWNCSFPFLRFSACWRRKHFLHNPVASGLRRFEGSENWRSPQFEQSHSILFAEPVYVPTIFIFGCLSCISLINSSCVFVLILFRFPLTVL